MSAEDAAMLRWARILVTGGETAGRLLVQEVLGRAGYANVRSAADIESAVAMFREVHPDLVIFLGVAGTDLARVLAPLAQEITFETYLPLLVALADANADTRLSAIHAGASDFVTQPIHPAELRIRVANLLRTRLLYQRVNEQERSRETGFDDRTREMEALSLDALDLLAIVAEYRDDETHEHPRRVGRVAAAIASALALPQPDVDLIARAAPLHDLGKAAIPDRLLLKEGVLTENELQEVSAHTRLGASLLDGKASPLLQTARDIALYHHERWDGGGYEGLRGSSIPISARIVTVADVFDVLTHPRPYGPAWRPDTAVGEIRRLRNEQFCPEAVDAFVQVVAETGADAVARGETERARSTSSGPAAFAGRLKTREIPPSQARDRVEPVIELDGAPVGYGPSGAGRATILVADDFQPNVTLLRRALGAEGFAVTGITDASLIVPTYRRLKPDLLILDLHMPRMDGLEVLSLLREEAPDPRQNPILIVTGEERREFVVQALSAGATQYVLKPLNMADFLARAEGLIAARLEALAGDAA